jgi:hypothetical protein
MLLLWQYIFMSIPSSSPLPKPDGARIPNPDVEWVTHVEVPGSPDEIWNTLKTMGPQDEGYGGYFLAAPGSIVNTVLPKKFKSPPTGETPRRQLELGDRFPDGHKGRGGKFDLSEVVELDNVARSIKFETQWTPSEQKTGRRLAAAAVVGGLAARFLTKEASSARSVKVVAPVVGATIGAAAMWAKSQHGAEPEKERLHYTTQFEVAPKIVGGEIVIGMSTITGTNRLANVKHPGAIAGSLYPRADQRAMKVVARNIARYNRFSKN